MNSDLRAYIEKALSEGVSPAQIASMLVESGWDEREVSAALSEIQGAPSKSPSAHPSHEGKARILIVDDEKNFLEIMSTKLKSAGYDTATAKNGKEAVEQARAFVPDLILMDIYMPDESGTDIALSIKQDPKTRDMRIAFLTSLKDPWPAMAGEKDKIARELGMEDFIQKTDDLDVIAKKVGELLSR